MAASGGNTNSDVTIIGGGIIGCSLAYDLAKQGARVRLLERRELAREASWASAGIISPPTPGRGGLTEMSLIAFRRYPQLVAEIEQATGISTGWNLTGELVLATEDMTEPFEATLAWRAQHGVDSSILDAAALHKQEPAAHEQFTQALYVPTVASVMVSRMTIALARAAAANGALIHEHTPVTRLEIAGGRVARIETLNDTYQSETVVIAAGAWSRTFSASLDFSIPTIPVRGQMFAVADAPVQIHSILAHNGVYIVPRADGTVAVGATEEDESGFDTRVTPEGMAWLVSKVDQIAPSLNRGRIVATWAGLRPGTADGEPIIGRLPHLANVWVATGHYRNGAMLAPGTSELLAASIAANDVDPRLADFDPSRFQ